jgi:uncharacterized repeat protein (TIGR03803 family)
LEVDLTAQLTTVISFNGINGQSPYAGLIADANGDLFGTTANGGANGVGTVFEIVNTGAVAAPVYASAPTTLVSFNSSDGAIPYAGLIADANGDLFGTTADGGANGDGTAFEIVNSGTVAAPVYASAPTTLVSFNGGIGQSFEAGLIADANGDLFGTTANGGANGVGTVFEIKNTGTVAAPVYASAPTTLVSFNGSDGDQPAADLIIDANGDLFGTTPLGGGNNDGTVFEIVNSGTVAAPIYASVPTTLAAFNGSNGREPYAGLTVDANGDLFGTTRGGGANFYGTVFEIKNNGTVAAPVYASALTTLVSFNDGADPRAVLIADANGDLFGTTSGDGAYGDGTAFEIKNTGTVAAPVYASAPTTLISFNYSNGAFPLAGLIADANGDLFGTTQQGGANGDGTVFEVTGTGFISAVPDRWNNNGDWNLNAATDWSLGSAPTSSTPAEIETGSATISTSGAAGLLTIDSGATLNLDDGTSLFVTDLLDNAGTWTLGGGDTATIGGSLANSGAIDIGATGISASTTVTAASLDNAGDITLQGAAASGATNNATLDITGAAPTVLVGTVVVAGDARLEFGSGRITTIVSGVSLRLGGAEAQILTDGGGSSALTGLTENDGTLLLRGDSIYGAGGARLTTTTSFTNVGTTDVDHLKADGGSAVTFGGTLTNDGTFDIGNGSLSAATTVTANGLNDTGTLTLLGSGSALAELIVNGAAATTGDITVGARSEIDVMGSNSFTQLGGSTTVSGSLVAAKINANAGKLDFKSRITRADGVGALNIGSLGTLEFDAAVDHSHAIKFRSRTGGTLALSDAGAFKGTIEGFAGADAIDLLGGRITRLAYSRSTTSGVLTVFDSTSRVAELSFDGDYRTSSFTFASDGHGGERILYR